MSRTVPILLYHSIAEEASAQFRKWAVRPRDFAAQMGYLHENGYTPMTVTRLAVRPLITDTLLLSRLVT